LNVVAKANVPWELEIMLKLGVVGASAQVIGEGHFTSESVVGSPLNTVGGVGTHLLPVASTPALGTAFDSTAAQAVNLFGTWSLNNGDSIQSVLYTLESLN
jgi:hypothetical protein